MALLRSAPFTKGISPFHRITGCDGPHFLCFRFFVVELKALLPALALHPRISTQGGRASSVNGSADAYGKHEAHRHSGERKSRMATEKTTLTAAIIGAGRRGRVHGGAAVQIPGVQIVAICDP